MKTSIKTLINNSRKTNSWAALALATTMLVGCGPLAVDHADKVSHSADAAADAAPALSLALPAGVPAEVNQVKIKVREIDTVMRPCHASEPCNKHLFEGTYSFSTNEKSMKIEKLKPGLYSLEVTLLDAKSGKIYMHGDGQVMIFAGQTARADITLESVACDSGDLVITLHNAPAQVLPLPLPLPAPFPGGFGDVCNPVGIRPSCVKAGDKYTWQEIRPAGTSWCGVDLAKGSSIVEEKFCATVPH